VGSSTTDAMVEVTMPQMGVSVSEGTILEWRKRPGDWIEADETICDVTTDKVDVEIPAPASGRLQEILVEAGKTVEVGTPIAWIDGGAQPGQAHPEEHPVPPQAPPEDAELDRSEYYSPIVRRLAAKHAIDLVQVTGTGVGGRIRKRDVLAFLKSGGPAAPQERPLHTESPYRPDEPAAEPAIPGSREPLSPMRRAIAAHMVESLRTSAHCTTNVEVDMGAVAKWRAAIRQAMERRGVKLTYLAFVAQATVEALQEFPVLNSSIDGDEIVYHHDVHLGIAVALEERLIVPVIRNAQRLSLEGLAAGIQDVAERARSKRLEPDDVQGGTFTLTNPGQFGAVLATPIINQPQVGILDLEAIVKRPVVISQTAPAADAKRSSRGEAFDSIAIRPMTSLCMSWDHRALDGAIAARFLGSVKARLEGWEAGR
jgi:pyruvate/2-oxoglutarate dehydrogenase complex dihydrolipoamide acyltransferase (E2) component